MTSDAYYTAKLLVAPTASAIGGILSEFIIESCCKPALVTRGVFTVALSGGSLPSFLQELPSYCRRAGVDPRWEKWHVLLADERCVASTDAESNLGSIRSKFTDSVRKVLVESISASPTLTLNPPFQRFTAPFPFCLLLPYT
jgi:6-phosphogluconolactonase/glucosamine-6-phosphate isomerase/deaminase